MTAPTVIPGTRRRRLEITPAQLRRYDPTASAEGAARASRLIAEVPVDGGTDRLAVLWGQQLQRDYSGLMSETIELSGDAALERAGGYVSRMIAILSAIDLPAIFGAEARGTGLVRYLKKLNGRVDTPDELAAARLELDQLLVLMGDALEPLLALKERLEAQSRRVDDTGAEIEASALAARFLADHFAKNRPDLGARFMDRALSLTQTLAQIRGSASLREAQIAQPLSLIAAIQNVALVSVPAWLGTVAALNTALGRTRTPTPTEAGELAYRLRTILQQLKL